MDPAISLFIVVACLILVALLSSSEVAFIAANKIKLRHLAEKGNSRAQTVQRIREEHDRFFSAVILSGNLFTILATSIGTAFTVTLFDAEEIGIIVATVVMTFLTVVFGELAPKTYAVRRAERIALALAKPVDIYIRIISPLIWVFTQLSTRIIRWAGGKKERGAPYLTEDEMKAMISMGEEEGTLEKEEKEMLHNVFEFGDKEVSEAMVPRTEITAIGEDAVVGDLLNLVSEKGYSRYPVIRESVDNITGILYVKDIIRKMATEEVTPGTPIQDIPREAYYIPENKMVTSLLDEMQKKKFHIAIVLDEHGGTAGLITLEDIMEEIVGGLQDEFETIEAEKEVEVVDERTFVVSGTADIDEISDLIGTGIEREEFNTIGGFLFGLFGHLPKVGDQLRHRDLRFLILEMEGKKIEKIKITKL